VPRVGVGRGRERRRYADLPEDARDEGSDGAMRTCSEIPGMVLLADLRRLVEHRSVLGRMVGLGRRDRQVRRAGEEMG
jgi:hypothetical protein